MHSFLSMLVAPSVINVSVQTGKGSRSTSSLSGTFAFIQTASFVQSKMLCRSGVSFQTCGLCRLFCRQLRHPCLFRRLGELLLDLVVKHALGVRGQTLVLSVLRSMVSRSISEVSRTSVPLLPDWSFQSCLASPLDFVAPEPVASCSCLPD